MSDLLLLVQGLSVGFIQEETWFRERWSEPIRDLNAKVFRKEVTAVVGASGSGKSLLAHAVMGVLPYGAFWNGRMEYQGKELTKERLKKLRGKEITLIPQGVNGLDPLMKAGNQIRKGRRDKESFRRCKELLKRYGLPPETEDMYPFELSGGMARRVLIAGAMMEDPHLVIADEPTPGLDDRAARQVMRHFREIADQGAGVLLITHDLELSLEMADRVLIFLDGRVVEELEMEKGLGDTEIRKFKRAPQHPYTKDLLESIPGGKRPWAEEGGEEQYLGQSR